LAKTLKMINKIIKIMSREGKVPKHANLSKIFKICKFMPKNIENMQFLNFYCIFTSQFEILPKKFLYELDMGF
jgi:hypothetical protein